MTIFSRLIMKVYGAGYRDAWPTFNRCRVDRSDSGQSALRLATSSRRPGECGWVVDELGWRWSFFVHVSPRAFRLIGFGVVTTDRYAVHAVWTMGFAYMIIRERTKQEKQEKEGRKIRYRTTGDDLSPDRWRGLKHIWIKAKAAQFSPITGSLRRARSRWESKAAYRFQGNGVETLVPMDTTKQRSPDPCPYPSKVDRIVEALGNDKTLPVRDEFLLLWGSRKTSC